MNKVFKNAGLALGLAFVGTVFAQDAAPESGSDVSNDWHISIGLSYRDFKAPKFYSAPSFVASMTQEVEYSGNAEFDPARPGSIVVYDGITGVGGAANGSYGTMEQLGFNVGGEYALWQNDSLTLNLAANFQYFELDSASRGGSVNYSAATAAIYPYYMGEIGPLPLPGEVNTNLSNGYVKVDMDMELYVFDLGVSLDYEFENSFVLSIAAGPAVYLADINSRSKSKDIGGASTSKHDDDLEFEYGFYISGGLAYWFSEQLGLSFDLRYDNAFGTVGTKYVSQNLDAVSGQLQILFRF